jgi:CDP-diacylglycerol---glycerol-3-phosphate 3-phosphatidyltransferase
VTAAAAGPGARDGKPTGEKGAVRDSKIFTAMLNFLRPAFQRLFNPVIQALARTPVTPNMITVVGTVGVSASALVLFPIGELFPGAFSATIFVLTDMLDGMLARVKGDSGPWGAFLDSTMDRFADAAVFGGITIWFMRNPADHVLAVVSLFCLACGLCVSYVKARAQGLGLKCDVGLIERPERLVIGLTSIGLSGLGVPYILPIGLWALAAGSLFTLGQRMRAVYQDAKRVQRTKTTETEEG